MVESKQHALEHILKKLGNMGDVDGSAIVTRDGLLIASQLSSEIDAETFAAMSATMVGAAETAIAELKKGSVERVIVESKETKLVATGAGSNALLVTMVGAFANLGLVLVEMKKAAEEIEVEMR